MKRLIFTLALALLPLCGIAGIMSGPSGGTNTITITSDPVGTLTNNTTGNAATATYATNAESQGVILIVGNNTTNFYGFGITALTNAIAASSNFPGSTVRAGAGIYYGGNIISWPVNIVGSPEPSVWDSTSKRFYGGTIITNVVGRRGLKFDAGYSNSVLANLSIEGETLVANDTLLQFYSHTTNNVNSLIENVNVGQITATHASEPVFLSGSNITLLNFGMYDCSGGHGLILKGVSSFRGEDIYLQNTGEGGGGESIFLEGNELSNGNGSIVGCYLHRVIIHNSTNGATPVLIGNADYSTIADVDISDVDVVSPHSASIINISYLGTNNWPGNIIRDVRISKVSASASNCSSFLMMNSYPTNGVITNIFFHDSSLCQTSVVVASPVTYNWYVPTNNVVRYADISINGVSHFGSSGIDQTNAILSKNVTSVYAVSNMVLFGLGAQGQGYTRWYGGGNYGDFQIGQTLQAGMCGMFNYANALYMKGASSGGIIWNDAGNANLAGWNNLGQFWFSNTITGNGSGLTNLNAANLTGGPITNAISTGAAVIAGNGIGVTNLSCTNLVGTLIQTFPTNTIIGYIPIAIKFGTTNLFIPCVYTNQ